MVRWRLSVHQHPNHYLLTKLFLAKAEIQDTEGQRYTTATGQFITLTNAQTRKLDSQLRYQSESRLFGRGEPL